MLEIKQWTIGNQNVSAVSARELHGALQIGRDFSSWVSGRIEGYGFEEGIDFCTGFTESGGRPLKEYHVTLSMAYGLCLLEREPGRELRRHIESLQNAPVCPEKAMHELTLEDLDQSKILKACIRCKTPFHGIDEICSHCKNLDRRASERKDLIESRHPAKLPESPVVECLIPRNGDTTVTAPFTKNVYTFRKNEKGHYVCKVDNPRDYANILKSSFYRPYQPEGRIAA